MTIEKYKPSNGTEGEIFQAHWCDNCKHDDFDDQTCTGGCSILSKTMLYDVDDPDYPSEWQVIDGKPECKAFARPGAPDRCDKTIDFLEL